MNDAKAQQILMEHFLARMEREPEDVQHAAVRYAENLMNGCNWAFISSKSETFAKETKAFEKSPIVTVYNVKNGVLITTPMETILNILTRVSPEIYTPKEKELALKFRQKSVENFVNFLRSGVKQAKIGIYNLNDSPNITIQGKIYKAFNMDLASVCMYLRDAGYSLVIEGKKLPAEYALITDRYPLVHERLEMAPSGNGLMLDIVKNG